MFKKEQELSCYFLWSIFLVNSTLSFILLLEVIVIISLLGTGVVPIIFCDHIVRILRMILQCLKWNGSCPANSWVPSFQ